MEGSRSLGCGIPVGLGQKYKVVVCIYLYIHTVIFTIHVARRDLVPPPKSTTHIVYSLKFSGQPDDDLYTVPKHVVLYYISLLIIIIVVFHDCMYI